MANKGQNGIIVIQTNFWLKRCQAFQKGQKQLLQFVDDPKFIAGLMLYWAEGSKGHETAISNSDVNVIRFMVKWFGEFFAITPSSLVLQLHIHSGQNEQNLRQYWSGVTGVPLNNFGKGYTKPENNGQRKKKLYYGTVKMRVKGLGSTYLLYQILGAIAEFNNRMLSVKASPEAWIQKPKYAQ